MRPLTARALLLLGLTGLVQARQVEVSLSADLAAGRRPAATSLLSAPTPINLAITPLTSAPSAMNLAQAGLLQPAIIPQLAAPFADPVLSAMPRASVESFEGASLTRDAFPEGNGDPGRARFDQSGGTAQAELDPVALRAFGRQAAAHYSQPWSLKAPGVRRSDGIKGGAHEESLFRAALAEAHGETELERPVPGFPGMTYVRYRLYQSERGKYLPTFKKEVFEKTIIDPTSWPQERLADLAGTVFAGREKDGQHVVEYRGITFIGWIRKGKLDSFGVDSWPGQPPLFGVHADGFKPH